MAGRGDLRLRRVLEQVNQHIMDGTLELVGADDRQTLLVAGAIRGLVVARDIIAEDLKGGEPDGD